MKNQLLKLLPLLAIAISAPAFAVNNYPIHNAVPGQIAAGEMGNRSQDLSLTPAQQAKIAQLRAASRSQIAAVLTPAQRQKFSQIQTQQQATRQDGQGMKMVMNLTADQRTKLKAIRESNQAQFKAILTPAQQAQLPQRGSWRHGGMARLNLTPAQQTKFQQLQTSARSQMQAVLTPEQQQQFDTIRERRQTMGNTLKSLNLSADQQAKIQAILQSSEQQLKAILTPEQQAQRKSRHGNHGRHHVRHQSV